MRNAERRTYQYRRNQTHTYFWLDLQKSCPQRYIWNKEVGKLKSDCRGLWRTHSKGKSRQTENWGFYHHEFLFLRWHEYYPLAVRFNFLPVNLSFSKTWAETHEWLQCKSKRVSELVVLYIFNSTVWSIPSAQWTDVAQVPVSYSTSIQADWNQIFPPAGDFLQFKLFGLYKRERCECF